MIEDYNLWELEKEDIEVVSISHQELKNRISELSDAGIPLFRKNSSGKLVTIPVNLIERYLGDNPGETTFYMQKEWDRRIERFRQSRHRDQQRKMDPTSEKIRKAISSYGNTFEQVEQFQNLSIEKREEKLDVILEELYQQKEKSRFLDINLVVKMVEVIANTFYASYACLEDNDSGKNVKNNISGIIAKTEWMIQIILEIFQREDFTPDQYSIINKIDTGSDTIDQMCKGFLWFMAYCIYYNNYIDSGLVTRKIRVKFNDKYLRYYKRRMPDQDLSIERIFKGGLRRIDPSDEMKTYAIGSLLYDVGKIPFIAYYNGDGEYDNNMVRIHTLTGYNLILKAKKYPFAILAMTALHHEYYGGRKSYNFTNAIISKLLKKKRSDENAGYFITYSEKDFISGEALGYFPCKLIEIVDIFNGLTVGGKNSIFDAFVIMKKEFIAHSLKIDPLLFEIFLEFQQDCGLISPQQRRKIDEIIY